MKSNVHRIEDRRRRHTEVEEQREVAADAIRNVTKELRKLESMEHDRGDDRAS